MSYPQSKILDHIITGYALIVDSGTEIQLVRSRVQVKTVGQVNPTCVFRYKPANIQCLKRVICIWRIMSKQRHV